VCAYARARARVCVCVCVCVCMRAHYRDKKGAVYVLGQQGGGYLRLAVGDHLQIRGNVCVRARACVCVCVCARAFYLYGRSGELNIVSFMPEHVNMYGVPD
jgi:hypothetical protein